jgi:hypothetical protein
MIPLSHQHVFLPLQRAIKRSFNTIASDQPAVLCLIMWTLGAANLTIVLTHLFNIWPCSSAAPPMIRLLLVVHLLPIVLFLRLILYLLRKLPANPFQCNQSLVSSKQLPYLKLNRRHSERMVHNLLIELAFTLQLILLLMLNRSIPSYFQDYSKCHDLLVSSRMYRSFAAFASFSHDSELDYDPLFQLLYVGGAYFRATFLLYLNWFVKTYDP